MIRKFLFLFLLCAGFHSIVKAQTEDSVSIYLPYGSDTTCPGLQLTFTAVQTDTSNHTTAYHWYTNGTFTGVIIDTFYTTALGDGDSVYCKIFFINSLGVIDSAKSNVIIVHRSSAIPPRVVISLTSGDNPGCGAFPLTFTALPVNGGTSPVYQWRINGVDVPGADSTHITRYFNAGDTVTAFMVSNSPCRTFDTAFSWQVPIIHDSITAGNTIVVSRNPICAGTLDTFTATFVNPGSGYTISWYVDSVLIPTAIGNVYITDSLHNGDLVYCVLNAPDPCIINHNTVSNVITMTVIALTNPAITLTLTHGANPSCLDSTVTYVASYTGTGTGATTTWFVNGVATAFNTTSYTSLFANGDLLTYRIETTDGGCYTHDSLTTPAILMVRDSTPVTPLVSLIGNLLVANIAGGYTWYYNGIIIPGATGQTYHPLSLGNYYAIRDSANCPSLPSNTIYISLLEVNGVSNAGNVKVYPNPTNGLLNLDWGNNEANVKMDVYNMVGQGLLHEDINGKTHHETDLSYLPEGNYLVVLRDSKDGTPATFKISIRK